MLFQDTVMRNSAYQKEAQVLSLKPFTERGSYLKDIYDVLSVEDKAAYKEGRVPTIKAPAPAKAVEKAAKAIETDSEDDAAASAGKAKIDTDSEGENYDFGFYFDWSKDSIFDELGRAWPFFEEDDHTAISLWYIDELTACRNTLDGYASEKGPVLKVMLQRNLSTMAGMNQLIKDTWEDFLSEPCFLDNEWHPEIKLAMDKWKKEIPSASLDRFKQDSVLHNCIFRDFQVVKKKMDENFSNCERYTWNQFATNLLCLCKEQAGNGPRDKTKLDHKALLANVEGEAFVIPPDQAYA